VKICWQADCSFTDWNVGYYPPCRGSEINRVLRDIRNRTVVSDENGCHTEYMAGPYCQGITHVAKPEALSRPFSETWTLAFVVVEEAAV